MLIYLLIPGIVALMAPLLVLIAGQVFLSLVSMIVEAFGGLSNPDRVSD